MQLSEQRDERQLFVRKADATSVVVIDRLYATSLLLSASEAVDFSVRTVDAIDATAIARILGLRPEIVLLGTGARAVFPTQAVLGAFLRHGIGLETMDNGAAARTFNLLAGEGRKVVAVFLLPG